VVRKTALDFFEDDCPMLAAAVSFYSVVSLAPLLIVLVAVGGAVLGAESVRAEIVEQAHRAGGEEVAGTVARVLGRYESPRFDSLAAVLGIAALFYGATRVLSQLQTALNRVWGVDVQPSGVRDWLSIVARKRALTFLMLAATTLLIGASLVLSTVVNATAERVAPYLHLPSAAFRAIDAGVSVVLATLLFAALYRILPDARVRWKDTWIGAAVTAVLFAVGRLLIGLYLAKQSPDSAYGAAGSLVVFLLWIYYSMNILLVGAEFTQAWSARRGERVEPEPYATRVDPGGGARPTPAPA
jgi:membrane protein